MSRVTFNRTFNRGVIFAAVIATAVGASAGVPIYSEATGARLLNLPPAGIFASDQEAMPSVPGSQVQEDVSVFVDEATRHQEAVTAQKSTYDLGRATVPSQAMTQAEVTLTEALSGFEVSTLESDTDAFLFAHADLFRARSTSTSTTVGLHVSSVSAEAYLGEVESSVSEWRTSVDVAFEAWKVAVNEENARIVEEERLRAEAEARRQAELEAQRQAEAQAAARLAAQRNSQPASATSSTPANVSAPVAARPAGETAAQRVNRLQARLGINVSYVFAACDTPRAMGCYLPGQASFRITPLGLSKNDRTLCGTILHESRHIQQHQQGLIKYTGDGGYANAPWLESDANAYMNSHNTC